MHTFGGREFRAPARRMGESNRKDKAEKGLSVMHENHQTRQLSHQKHAPHLNTQLPHLNTAPASSRHYNRAASASTIPHTNIDSNITSAIPTPTPPALHPAQQTLFQRRQQKRSLNWSTHLQLSAPPTPRSITASPKLIFSKGSPRLTPPPRSRHTAGSHGTPRAPEPLSVKERAVTVATKAADAAAAAAAAAAGSEGAAEAMTWVAKRVKVYFEKGIGGYCTKVCVCVLVSICVLMAHTCLRILEDSTSMLLCLVHSYILLKKDKQICGCICVFCASMRGSVICVCVCRPGCMGAAHGHSGRGKHSHCRVATARTPSCTHPTRSAAQRSSHEQVRHTDTRDPISVCECAALYLQNATQICARPPLHPPKHYTTILSLAACLPRGPTS
jgi:hypothetical protein